MLGLPELNNKVNPGKFQIPLLPTKGCRYILSVFHSFRIQPPFLITRNPGEQKSLPQKSCSMRVFFFAIKNPLRRPLDFRLAGLPHPPAEYHRKPHTIAI